MSRRSQSQKKRHTKPCKFFQLNRCPHTAEVCDFAHVLGGPILAEPSPLCRYYFTGHCAHGTLCKYRHEALSPFENLDTMSEWGAMTSPELFPDTPPGYKTFAPYAQRWPSSMAIYSPPAPFSPQSPQSLVFSPSSRSRDSIQSLDTVSTANTSLESDDVMIVTDDPQYDEHAHAHQSQICVTEETPIVHVSPFQHAPLYVRPPPLRAYDYSYAHTVSGKPRLGSPKSSTKQKALKYKTKPCKFWATEKGCPNGGACTFAHDEIFSRSPSPPSPKSPSEKDDTSRKNFVPIQWRVIGGGVLVSTAKKDSNEGEKFVPSIDCSLPLKPANLSLPPLKIITRQRSNSIPTTPSIIQVNVEHLFSAESPGIL